MSIPLPANPSPELQTALKWIDGFNRWDIDQLSSVFSEDYMHHVLPKSLGIQPRNKEAFKEYFTSIMPMLTGFTITIHEIIESPGTVFLHASSKATSTTGFPYANEYNLTLHFTPQRDGLKISSIKEFVDSKFSVEFFTEERKRQAAKRQAGIA